MKRHLLVAALGISFFASNTTAYAQVRADSSSIAIGGSVTSSTVIIGIPQEKVDELVRDAKRPLEELTAQQRENIILLREKLASAQSGDTQKVTSLKAQAQKAIEEGELAKADAFLADVETEQRRALDLIAANAVETLVKRAEIAFTRLRYAEAAKHLANAAAVFSSNGTHEEIRIGFLQMEALALYLQGDEFDSAPAGRRAKDPWRARERHEKAGRGRHRFSRGAEGKDP
jgi:hypothetical protein